jgi:hypothetical protein
VLWQLARMWLICVGSRTVAALARRIWRR